MAVASLAMRSAAFSRPDALISHSSSFAGHCVRGKRPKNRIAQGMNLTALSDSELDVSFKKIGWVETTAVADSVEHLVEVEGRRLHLTSGFPGVIDYCMQRLGCSAYADAGD